MATVADRIRLLLIRNNWSARELGRRAGLAETHISLLLKKLDRDPLAVELKTLDAIARGAGVSLAWLATGSETEDRPADPRAEAIAFARDVLHPETLRWASETQPVNAEHLDRVGWLRALLWHDDFVRGGAVPPSSGAGAGRRRR